MLTVYSDTHHEQAGKAELINGTLMPCFENPSRADMVREAVDAAGFSRIGPTDHGKEPILAVHRENYVRFLETFWERWSRPSRRSATGRDYDALPLIWPTRCFRQVEPEDIDGQLGYFSMDAGTPVTKGTWTAIYGSAQTALTGADRLLAGEKGVFALCRPPGHHAAADVFGGYCFFNNAAIAAQHLRDKGCSRVAVLDVDYHHGNGTQSIFYDRADVLFASIHGDPRTEFPFYLGFADEKGEDAGLGFNHNFPLPAGSDVPAWMGALTDACRVISAFRPDALVVSLGIDTYQGDPISTFKLDTPEFVRMGEQLGRLGVPTLFCLEGGYAVGPIGANAVAVLSGYDGTAHG